MTQQVKHLLCMCEEQNLNAQQPSQCQVIVKAHLCFQPWKAETRDLQSKLASVICHTDSHRDWLRGPASLNKVKE